jgi:hypothetical protein
MKRDDSHWHEITVLSDEFPYDYGTLSGDYDKDFSIGMGLVDFYLRVRRKTKVTEKINTAFSTVAPKPNSNWPKNNLVFIIFLKKPNEKPISVRTRQSSPNGGPKVRKPSIKPEARN